ncbi:hypothetical protein ACVW06_000105 [Pantoea ananatis]
MSSFSYIQQINVTCEGFKYSHNGLFFQNEDLDMEYEKDENCILKAISTEMSVMPRQFR